MADKRGGDGGGDGKRKKAKYMARGCCAAPPFAPPWRCACC
jgi:hypothetical protein